LDRCVQRLRQRIVIESWEKKASKAAQSDKTSDMKGRVPSFFTSSSLVNMGGLAVADQPTTIIEATRPRSNSNLGTSNNIIMNSPIQPPKAVVVLPDNAEIPSGWGGLGLRGNRSSVNLLARNASEASGLFIDEEHEAKFNQDEIMAPSAPPTTNVHTIFGGPMMAQRLGSHTSLNNGSKKGSESSFNNMGGYVKTTSMAQFYYRNVAATSSHLLLGSAIQLNYGNTLRKTTSDPNIGEDEPGKKKHHNRRKSKSEATLSALVKQATAEMQAEPSDE
jgi:hypothetical protein